MPRSLKKTLTIADTGATDHMFPDRSAFISYHKSSHIRVRLGNNTFTPVLGTGTAIISLNGKRVLVRNALHVPGLRCPLYSLRAHVKQKGCGFIGAETLGGVFVYFPDFILEVDTSKDCTLSYSPVGKKVSLCELDYAQPKMSSCSAAAGDAPPQPPSRLGSDWRKITSARRAPEREPSPGGTHPTPLPEGKEDPDDD